MVTVREGTRDDVETIVDFQLLLAKETEDVALDRETVTRGVHAVFDAPERGSYLIAENGDPVACLLTVPEWSDWRNGTVIWIHSVYVKPEARKQGVFRAMYTHLKRRVETEEDLKGLRLYVYHGNERAMGVYSALGMDGEYYRMFEWMP